MIAITMPKPKRLPHRTIAEALAAKVNEYALQPVHTCKQCPQAFTTRVGLREHVKLNHLDPPINPVTRYYVTMAHLPAFLAESKAELWKDKKTDGATVCAVPRADGI